MSLETTGETTNYLQDRVVFVTGAANGFGRLVSEGAAALGARVVCADIDEAGAAAVADGICANNGEAVGVGLDVIDAAAFRSAVDSAVDRFGAVDVLINNAGVMPLAFHRDHEAAMTAWSRCIDINIKGVVNGIAAVHDPMMAQGRGHVVNLSSIYGNFPVAGAGVYGASKAAVNFLSESLRMESRGKIKVTIVKPTGVPSTNLSQGIINPEAIVGILGANVAEYGAELQAMQQGSAPDGAMDPEDIGYLALAPEYLAAQIIHAINQPWGVVVGEITVRASADGYVL